MIWGGIREPQISQDRKSQEPNFIIVKFDTMSDILRSHFL